MEMAHRLRVLMANGPAQKQREDHRARISRLTCKLSRRGSMVIQITSGPPCSLVAHIRPIKNSTPFMPMQISYPPLFPNILTPQAMQFPGPAIRFITRGRASNIGDE